MGKLLKIGPAALGHAVCTLVSSMARSARKIAADSAAAEPRSGSRRAAAAHPRTRGVCRELPRPSLFVSCLYHLYLDVRPHGRSIRLNFPDKEVWELEVTCALDVAEAGGASLADIGRMLGLTRERIRQIEAEALEEVRDALVGVGGARYNR